MNHEEAEVEIHGLDPYGPEGEGMCLPDLIFLARALGVVGVFGFWLYVDHHGLEWPLVLVGGGLLFLGIAIVFDGPMRRRAARQGRARFRGDTLVLSKETDLWELPAPAIDAYSVRPEWIQLYVAHDRREHPCLAVPTPGRATRQRVVTWLDDRHVPAIP